MLMAGFTCVCSKHFTFVILQLTFVIEEAWRTQSQMLIVK